MQREGKSSRGDPRPLPEGFRWMTAKYDSGKCNICLGPVLAGDSVAWHPRRKTKMHRTCFEHPKDVHRPIWIRIVSGGASGLGQRGRKPIAPGSQDPEDGWG
jgi:hypothetical protein